MSWGLYAHHSACVSWNNRISNESRRFLVALKKTYSLRRRGRYSPHVAVPHGHIVVLPTLDWASQILGSNKAFQPNAFDSAQISRVGRPSTNPSRHFPFNESKMSLTSRANPTKQSTPTEAFTSSTEFKLERTTATGRKCSSFAAPIQEENSSPQRMTG